VDEGEVSKRNFFWMGMGRKKVSRQKLISKLKKGKK
jgi:hypothetical protein